ncbi:MAG: sulfide/dihydroorotate dehydrogenase-like FAD/NAD-binding protein [Candidatus Bathyarchaeota archaeon]|nr:sulfide/dihydroorotate dehydrogenase-like FAD/NAD-binding protein [Candidatus Bathyarchaeota archaeon]MDH5595695.1 sulfide/dihydroorotate dehydrogenase-like FAD/NAD-binding protein [Candidatus Bathyarchaeota archaeon]
MYKIVTKRELVPHINLFKFSAKEIATKTKPGQFIILRVDEKGERIPLTMTGADPEKGTITVVCHEVGKSTRQLGQLEEGDCILDLLGPLGKPAEIEKFGTVLCIGGGVMVAPLYFQAKALREAGNKVIGGIGARTESQLIFENEMREVCDELYVATDDGTRGCKGLDFLEELLKERKIDRVITMGPILMMKKVSELTRPYSVATIVNLIPIMVDGMGMCGACRVTVGGRTMFACVDGPDFDGHQVDFEELMTRLKMYSPQEKLAFVFYEEGGSSL